MVGSRTATALAGLALGLLVSAVAWYFFDSLLLFLVIPFVPLLLRRRGRDGDDRPPARRCPSCGFETTDPGFEYCPRDGRRLEHADRGP